MNAVMPVPSHQSCRYERVSILGVDISSLSLDQLLYEIDECIRTAKKSIFLNANIYAINIAYSEKWFRDFLNQSHVTFCDGFGIKLAALLTGQNLLYRYTPPDFIERIAELAHKANWRIFFLGAKPGVAQRAADRLIDQFPVLQIKTHHGYFHKDFDSAENKSVIEQINQFQPHILVLGFGMPVQEKWLLENLPSLNTKVAFPAGALFDYLSGDLPRAPRWVTDNGFEWLTRLFVEPRRLWKRYLIGNPLFFWRLFLHHFLGLPLPR